MDCYFTGHCHSRPQPCYQPCPELPRYQPCVDMEPCIRPCPPANDHLRPPAGVASGQGRQEEVDWRPDVYGEMQRPSQNPSSPRRHCLGQLMMDYSQPSPSYRIPVALSSDPLRFSRHAVEDRHYYECRPMTKAPPRVVQVGSQPTQMLNVEDYDPCPNKKGPDCDCFNPDGTWKDKSKIPKKPDPFVAKIPFRHSAPADLDPCPNKKGPDCDCFNPDGTWRDKSKDPVKVAKLDPCVTKLRKCEDNCPECPIEIHSRTVYPKCEAMVPGYGGHVPGLQVCKFGKTFGRETREALQKVYSTPLLDRQRKKC